MARDYYNPWNSWRALLFQVSQTQARLEVEERRDEPRGVSDSLQKGKVNTLYRSSGQIDAVRNFPSRQPEQGKIIMATSTTVRRPISIPSVRSISEVPRRRIKCGGSSAYSFRGTPWYRVKFCNLHHPLEAWIKYKARVPKMQHEEIFWLLLYPWLLSECSWK